MHNFKPRHFGYELDAHTGMLFIWIGTEIHSIPIPIIVTIIIILWITTSRKNVENKKKKTLLNEWRAFLPRKSIDAGGGSGVTDDDNAYQYFLITAISMF